MEDKQNQLFIQKDPDALREQWLRKDLWSLSELINLCCGSLDGTRPISPWAKKRFEEYEKRSKSQGTPVVSMPFDKSDLENERKEPATVAEEIIRRGIQSKALKITDRSAVDIQPEDRLYRSDYHFMPETAIQWTKSKLPLFLLFPFREENPNNLQIVSELEKWLYYDLWNPTELRDLCCGLEPDLSWWDSLSERIWKAKDQHLPIDPKDRFVIYFN